MDLQRSVRVAGIGVLLLIADDIRAQACMGRPSFSAGRIQLAVLGQIGDHATALGGEASVGEDRSLFAHAGIAWQTSQAGGFRGDPSGRVISGGFGYQLAAADGGRGQLCPAVSVQWGRLEVSDNANLEHTQLQVGAMYGLARPTGTGLHVVPFGGLAFAQLSRDLVMDEPSLGFSYGTDIYFPLTVGVGLHFKRSFAIVSDLTIPIDLSGADPSVAIRAVFALGGR